MGSFVGLGDGIEEGLDVGILVVGSFVGAGVGMLDGMGLGEGDGINDGLEDGTGVVGKSVGEIDGRFVGLHVVHDSSKLKFSDVCPNGKTSHVVDISGGVLLQPVTSSKTAIALDSPAIIHLLPSSSPYPQ